MVPLTFGKGNGADAILLYSCGDVSGDREDVGAQMLLSHGGWSAATELAVNPWGRLQTRCWSQASQA